MASDPRRAALERAVQMHQRGQLSEAAALYRGVLRDDPDNVDALRLLGICHFQGGQFEAGLPFLEQASALRPDNAELHNDIAKALHTLHRHDEAIARYRRAVAVRPRYADAHHNLAIALHAGGRTDEAVVAYHQAILIRPGHAETFNNLGVALNVLGRPVEALAAYRQALTLKSDYAEAHANLANALDARGDHAEAVFHYQQALAGKPRDAEIHNNLGIALKALRRFDEAITQFETALRLRPGYGEAHSNLGATLQATGRHQDAIAHYQQALPLSARPGQVHNNLANAYRALGRVDEAIAQYRQALTLEPELAEAHNNLGNALARSGCHMEAIACYEAALRLAPRDATTHNNIGCSLVAMHQSARAIASFRRAIDLKPDYAEAHSNLGLALADQGRFREAVSCHELALAARPDSAEIHNNLANALKGIGRHEAAIAHYEKAFALAPDLDFLAGTLAYTKMAIADWHGTDPLFARIAAGIADGRKLCDPFGALSMPLSEAQLRRCAEIYAQDMRLPGAQVPPAAPHTTKERLRIGYFSADLHRHATAYLLAGLFEHHDRDAFEIVAFSYGPPKEDAMRQRLLAAFDRFIDVRDTSDEEVANLARELEIDIAVDLKGYTKDGRPGIFARRAAPLQVSYMGYPGTLGADHMDYLVADATVLPASARDCYREKIITLPDSYWCTDDRCPIGEQTVTRRDVGLPDEGFVFCCFNRHYKITPEIFALWMRLLAKVEGSVLWLFEDSATGVRNLRAEAAARGIAPERLIFAPGLDLPQHLARHRLADLVLDTPRYNAHTTASDALWAGVPVITCPGETFVGRVAASILRAVGLPTLIADTPAAYEALAIGIATHPQTLRAVKDTLAATRATAPLFDTARFTRHIEAAYQAMWRRHAEGLAPDDISIPATVPLERSTSGARPA